MKAKIFLIFAAFVFVFTSCLEDGLMNGLDEYKTVIYFPKSDLNKVVLYKTGQNTFFDLNIYKGGSDKSTEAIVNVKLLSQAQLDDYNTTNRKTLQLLPDSCYKINSGLEVKFESGVVSKSVQIEFYTDKIDALGSEVLKNTVLPFELFSGTDSVNSEKNMVLLNPEVVTPVISFQKEGLLLYNAIPDQSEEIPFESFLKLPVKSLWNFTVKLKVDPALVAAYNTEKNEQYVILPDSAYSLPNDVEFVKGDILKKLNLKVDLKKLKLGYYMLPIRIDSTDMDGLVVDEKTQLIAIDYQPAKSSMQRLALTNTMLSMQSSFIKASDGGGIDALIDSKPETYLHSAYSPAPKGDALYGVYFDVDMKQSATSMYFQYITRSYANGAPKKIALYVSDDKSTWELLGTINSGLPQDGGIAYDSKVISSQKSFSYLRFSVLEGKSGVMNDPSKDASFFAMAEFAMWIK